MPDAHQRQCFPLRMGAMFREPGGEGGGHQAPTETITEPSSFCVLFLFFFVFIFLSHCFRWKAPGWSDEVAWGKMFCPLLCSLPLEIIPAFPANVSPRCGPVPLFRLFGGGKLHAGFSGAYEYKTRNTGRNTVFLPLFFPFTPNFPPLLPLPLPPHSAFVWCDAHIISAPRPELAPAVSRTLASEHCNCNRE